MQLISAFLLLYAVFTIRKYIKKGLKADQINEKNMILHAASFFLLGVGLVVENVYYIIANVQNTSAAYAHYIESVAIGGIINFTGQLLLCKIFSQFGQPLQPEQYRTYSGGSHRSEVSANSHAFSEIGNEREAEMKARIWNQFMYSSVASHGEVEGLNEHLTINVSRDNQLSQDKQETSDKFKIEYTEEH
jgi:hypothetical protein